MKRIILGMIAVTLIFLASCQHNEGPALPTAVSVATAVSPTTPSTQTSIVPTSAPTETPKVIVKL